MRLLIASLALLVVSGCGGATGSVDGTPELGGLWTVARVGELAAVPGREPLVEFQADLQHVRVVIAECLDATAQLTIDGSSIRVGTFVPTAVLPCGGPAREFGGVLQDALAATTTITGSRGRLVVQAPESDVLLVRQDLELTSAEQEPADALMKGGWRYVDGDVRGSRDVPPLRFADGSFVAQGLCGFGGTYVFRGEDLIHLRDLSWEAGTGCSDAGDQGRADLAALLEQVDRFRFAERGAAVTFSGRGGEATFELVGEP